MSRDVLPDRRLAENREVAYNGVMVSLSFGYYDDGRIGEVFLSTRKSGTAVDTLARDTAVLLSLLLQYGCSARIISKAITCDEKGRPEGLAGIVAKIIEEETADG